MGDAKASQREPDLEFQWWLRRFFGDRGLTYPYVPGFAVSTVYVQPPSTATTSGVDPTELYLFHRAAGALLNGRVDSCYAVSFWGHGINSYAWTVLLQRPGLRLLAQVAFGRANCDADREERDLDDLFMTIRYIDGMVPAGIRRDIMVLMSDLRGITCTGWAPDRHTELDSWMQQASRVPPPLAVGDLIRRRGAWPERPAATPRFASRAQRLAHEAQVAYEWSLRFPDAADGAHDPAADLAFVLAIGPWPELPAPHRWLPASLSDRACWWCFGDKSDELHR